ncbi:protein STIP1 homolog [Hetaerina americana]|uniref:protein STIP1 homolog n=1 Tax=Hetaerina americana TaxID=62018 RepID=UPI003A7F58D5
MEDVVVGIGGRANIKAAGGDYMGAIEVLNAGIEKFPMETRFWNNRCYFLLKLKSYKKALEESDKMVQKFPNNLKSYFRKGEALVGLKMYKEADEAFNQVLDRNRSCSEANDQLLEIKVKQMMDLGYSRMRAQEAIACSTSLEEAIEFAKENPMTVGCYGDTIYHSDEGDFDDDDEDSYSMDGKHQSDKFMDPANPRGISSLWVGNADGIPEEELRKMFSAYGKIMSISVLESKRCAFVNFADAKAAGAAMKALQGKPVGNSHLFIKYPNNTFGKKNY